MSSADGGSGGLRDAAQQVLATLLDIGRGRLELLTVELEEERLRLVRLCLVAICTLFFALVGLALAVAWLVLWCEPQNRVAVTAGLTALFFAAAGLGAWQWRALARRRPAFLHATLAELERDREALKSGSES